MRLIAGCATALLAAACARPVPVAAPAAPAAPVASVAPGHYQPTATFQEIMDSVVDPAADYLWQSVSTIVDAKGIHERIPHTDAEWHELRRRAIVLVEAANLIAVPGRRVARGTRTVETGETLEVDKIQQRLDTRHEQLAGFAAALRAIGLKLQDDTDRRNVAALMEHGGTLDEVCEACHKVYWYPEN